MRHSECAWLLIVAILHAALGATIDKTHPDEVTRLLEIDVAKIDAQNRVDMIELQKHLKNQRTDENPKFFKEVELGPLKSTSSPPSDITRASTVHDWCDCKSGHSSVTIWPRHDKSQRFTVDVNSVHWVQFSGKVDSIGFSCDGMSGAAYTSIELADKQWLSLVLHEESKKVPFVWCSEPTGRMHWNVWVSTDYTSSVPFTTYTEGYDCFKIPALLRTAAGTLIAFSEARTNGCSDYSDTDLVYKRSTDGGKTWGALSVLVSVSKDERKTLGLCGHPLVIGNVAPVQLAPNSKKYPGRILAPHNRNNFETWLTHSDDDGMSWSSGVKMQGVGETEAPDCKRNMTYFGLDIDNLSLKHIGDFVRFAARLCSDAKDPFTSPWADKLSGPWQWVGVGPPGALQLQSGRVLIPAYHSYVRGLEGKGVLPVSQLYNNFAKGHTIISDDYGDTWRLGNDWPTGQGADENQLVLLTNGSILSNSRSLATGSPEWRVQARSDDEGETFTSTQTIPIPQPFNGCQGSSVGASNPHNFTGSDTIYVANPDPLKSGSVLQKAVDLLGCSVQLTGRERVSIWKSRDGGNTFTDKKLIDPGLSAQTSLQYHDGTVMLLYEQADPQPNLPGTDATKALIKNLVVLLPTRLVYREVAAFGQEILRV